MNQWGRRLGCLLLLLLWLIIMSLPLLTVVLARQGQMQVGRPESSQVRLFLLQERQVEGVGLEWSRPVRQQPGCRRTTVVYFMWRGEGENVRFVTCPAAVNPVTPGTAPAGKMPALSSSCWPEMGNGRIQLCWPSCAGRQWPSVPIMVGAGAAAAILSTHHDLPSAALALVTAVKGRDGAETRPFVLPKVIPRRPAPTVMIP